MTVSQSALKSYIQKLLFGSISESELSLFVQLARTIVESHLNVKRSSIAMLCAHQGLTITDLAYDSIAEAFSRDEGNVFRQIENFVNSLNNPLEEIQNESLFSAFRAFLFRIADAQLARLYAQSDPAGAKIYRNIRDCVKQSGVFILEKDYRGLVLRPRDHIEFEHLEAFPLEELEKNVLERIDHRRETQKMLDLLHMVLTEQTSYRKSVPLSHVVQIFRKSYRNDLPSSEEEPSQTLDGLTRFEIDQLRIQIEAVLKEKIVLTYFAKGKVTRKEAEAIFKTVQDIIRDWCDGEESRSSIYHYLEKYLSIDEKTYEETLRTKMEYLVKTAREEFSARLMREI